MLEITSSFSEKGPVEVKVFLKIAVKSYGKTYAKESNFSKLTHWFNMFLFNYTNLKWWNLFTLRSQINSFAEKYPFMKKLKSHFRIPCKQSFDAAEKDLLHKVSSNSRNFVFINFHVLQEIIFSQTFNFANLTIYISCKFIFPN